MALGIAAHSYNPNTKMLKRIIRCLHQAEATY